MGKIWIYTPGFPKRQGISDLMNMVILGDLPDYQTFLEGEHIHITHKKYKQYTIRIHSKYSGTYDASVFYDTYSANEHFKICLTNYPNSLIEYIVTNWKGEVLSYGWYKHFSYSKSTFNNYPSNPLESYFKNNKAMEISQKKYIQLPIEHPFESYLFRDVSRYSRADYDGDDGNDGDFI